MRPLSELPQELKDERRRQRRRQEDVAIDLGISREVLSRYENGKLNLSLLKAVALAEMYGYRVLVELEPIDDEGVGASE